jgi:hypothetical protein
VKASKIHRRLDESLRDRRIVTVVRDAFEIAMTVGFVIAITDGWVVLHSLDDGVYLDEIVMLRLEDISRVWFRDDDAYHHRAIESLGEAIAVFDCDSDANTIELLQAASSIADVFAIHMEVLEGEPLAVGRLIELRNKSIELHYVGRDGVWADESERWKYRHITRIEVGGRYLGALNTFADPFPAGTHL